MEEKISENQASSKVEINIPDISKVEIKTHKSNDKLPGFIQCLCGAQLLLILFVLFIVCCSCIQCSSCCSCKSGVLSGFNINPLDEKNFTAIILALITLCISLSILIPYIIGRAVTAKQIQKEAKPIVNGLYKITEGTINHLDSRITNILEKQNQLKTQIEESKKQIEEYKQLVNIYQEQVEKTKKDLERKYDKTIKQLQWSEGHLSRMIAYLLRYKQTKALSEDAKTKEREVEVKEICWSIGWSAKAMIRYFMVSGQGFHRQDFLNNCINYIIESSSVIYKLDVNDGDGRKKLIRAFIDLYDTFRFFKLHDENPEIKKEYKLGYTNINKVMDILKSIYKKFVADVPGTEYKRIKEIQEAIKDKAKWIEYLPNMDKNASGEEENAQKEKALEEAHNWLIKEGICDDKWMPRT